MLRAFVFVFLIIGTGCATRIPITERLEAEELFQHGLERLEARRWAAATEAFERFIFRFPGHPLQQEARYHLAQGYFGRREFLSAANEYLRLANEHPTHRLAPDARFGACESYARLSPRPQLDQQYTIAAIDHCEAMVAYYPESEHAPRARQIVTEMIDKLAVKQLEVGEHYFRRRAFDSAILSYNDLLDRFPQASSAPRALLRLIQVYERLGYEPEEEAARQRLLRDYPGSEEAREIQSRSVAGRT
jgi:outer membrane protein assembly factor BamD